MRTVPSQDGIIGKVERPGIALIDNCCGSAIAASNYLNGIVSGGAPVTMNIQVSNQLYWSEA